MNCPAASRSQAHEGSGAPSALVPLCQEVQAPVGRLAADSMRKIPADKNSRKNFLAEPQTNRYIDARFALSDSFVMTELGMQGV